MAEASILIILLCLAAVYLGYPLLLLCLAALAGWGKQRETRSAAAPQSVSIIICAHNEAASIGPKLRSVFASVSNRSETIETIVCDDGSSDGTANIVERVAEEAPIPLRLVRLPRGGKAAALREALSVSAGEILVFSDADPLWDEATLGALLEPFGNSCVGAVAGEVRSLRTGPAGAWRAGEALFRTYESAIRAAEDRLFGCVSADGGLFALRASLAEPVPADVTDDFFLSSAAVARGYRIAFRPEAAVYEVAPDGQRQHFRRRVRITVRGLTGVWRRRGLLNPFRTGAYAFGLLFHKLLRRLAPLLLVPLWLAVFALVLEKGNFASVCAFLLLSAGVVGTAATLLLPFQVPKLLRLPAYFGIHVCGLAWGTILFLGGKRYSQWTPQKR
jgi:cellulose synthase/poly-beta-1,6-N-acetylglucosamine synthase-like glycosyltransferase